MSFHYQDYGRYVAQVSTGLEELAAGELQQLGATRIQPGFRVVECEIEASRLLGLVYQSRLVQRILAPLAVFDCHSERYLYKRIVELDWASIFEGRRNLTFSVVAHVSKSDIRSANFAALRVKDAVVDALRDATGERPDVDTKNPDVIIHLHLDARKASLSYDLTGCSLHKRGYRIESVAAPLQETLAAAMIAFSGWDGISTPLIDPMCGSGTILCEALMKAAHIPAGYLRTSEAFRYLPDYDDAHWKETKTALDAAIKPIPGGLISGSDIQYDAVDASLINLECLPCHQQVAVSQGDFHAHKGLAGGLIVTNPPYGIRLEPGRADALIHDLGDFMKQKCPGSKAFLFLGDRALLKQVGLRTCRRMAASNGGLDGVVAGYELFAGSRKKRDTPDAGQPE